jgi:hypothetical protein
MDYYFLVTLSECYCLCTHFILLTLNCDPVNHYCLCTQSIKLGNYSR